mmetsp:Transcript_64095/g.167797  ORF Transcript_64095/g.167797 Transcript_64095/m.167797 type:complete len:227 (-) Transcript_64095:46-726(-)
MMCCRPTPRVGCESSVGGSQASSPSSSRGACVTATSGSTFGSSLVGSVGRESRESRLTEKFLRISSRSLIVTASGLLATVSACATSTWDSAIVMSRLSCSCLEESSTSFWASSTSESTRPLGGLLNVVLPALSTGGWGTTSAPFEGGSGTGAACAGAGLDVTLLFSSFHSALVVTTCPQTALAVRLPGNSSQRAGPFRSSRCTMNLNSSAASAGSSSGGVDHVGNS